jgi:7,8-dihydroneopterin aldolase/epimerase/oxygenase
VEIEVAGIELWGYHGVREEERRDGQRFLFDVALEVSEPAEDAIENAADYREIVAAVKQVSDSRPYQLLESLAAAVADELKRRFAAERVRVRVRKPDVHLDVEHVAATAER